MLRIFVSSTSKDLRHFRQVVGDVILEQRWHPVMMKHFGTSTGPTLHECLREVRSCDLLVLILAFRRGWVPTPEQGGDGNRSVTAAEVDEARRRGIPIRALLARGWGPPPENRNPIALLSGCVRSLARAPRQGGDGQFPLLRFVRSLGELRGGEEALVLRGWLDGARAQFGLDAAESATTPADVLETAVEPRRSASTCYLLVQVSPRLCEVDRYSVRAWLLGTGEPACICAGEDALTADALPACLDELREELLRRQIEPEQAWIELLLPRELLCADVDQWRVELDFIESIPIGVEHRLVVRSLARASRPRAAQALQSRARALRQRLRGGCRLVDGPASREGEAVWIEGRPRPSRPPSDLVVGRPGAAVAGF
jgi:hypothetical protein